MHMGPGTQAPPAGLNHIKHGGTKRSHNSAMHACASYMEAIPCKRRPAYNQPNICLNYVMARKTFEGSGLIRQFQTVQDVENFCWCYPCSGESD